MNAAVNKRIQEERKQWKSIYDRYFQPLCYFADGLLDDPQKAEDVVQSVLVKIWQDKTVFDDAHHIRNYLYKSVRNAAVNELNAESTHSRILKNLGDLDPERYKETDAF